MRRKYNFDVSKIQLKYFWGKVASMSTKKELKLLTELLNLEGVKVSSHRQHEGIGIILQIEAIARESVCDRCGSNSSKLHQNRWHIIKDFSWGEKAVFLEINGRGTKV